MMDLCETTTIKLLHERNVMRMQKLLQMYIDPLVMIMHLHNKPRLANHPLDTNGCSGTVLIYMSMSGSSK